MSRHKHNRYDLIAIGSGSGGSVGAVHAASLGKRVAIVEAEPQVVGGECPNWACVPTKALLYAAEIHDTVRNAPLYGVETGSVKLNYQHIKRWKDLVVSRTGAAEGEDLFAKEGIDVIRGKASFINPHEIKVGSTVYRSQKFLIGTGTTVAIPPITGLTKDNHITFRQAMDLTKLPKSIFILGGGAVGCEFSQIFSSFGVKVHIADFTPRLLMKEDKEVGDLIGGLFTNRGIDVLTNTQVIRVVDEGAKRVVHYQTHGRQHEVTVDQILVATGKRPVLDIGLEEAGVEFTKFGISVNRFMQTSQKHIYAAGDVVGPYLFTHTSSYQSWLAGHNAFSTQKLRASYQVVPRAVFTNPEVASVGMSEDTAREHKLRIKKGFALISNLGRANTANETNGFVKVITDPRGKLLGASIVAPRAGELIHELALGIQLNAKASQIAEMIHAYPTYSEAVKMACAAVE